MSNDLSNKAPSSPNWPPTGIRTIITRCGQWWFGQFTKRGAELGIDWVGQPCNIRAQSQSQPHG